MRLLMWVIVVSGLLAITSVHAKSTVLVMTQTVECEVADVDPTLVKVFQVDQRDKDKAKGECDKIERTDSAVISDQFLGIDYMVRPKGKPISFVPKEGVLIAGEKTWCGRTQVMNRGQNLRISVRILPAKARPDHLTDEEYHLTVKEYCRRPPEGSFFLREFRLERDAADQLLLKQVCLLPTKQDICIGGEQLKPKGIANAALFLKWLGVEIKVPEPKEHKELLAQFLN